MGHKLIKFKLMFWKIDMYWVKVKPIKQQRSTNCKKLLRWNQVNTDTTGTMDNCLAISVRIIRWLSQAKTGQLVLLIAYTCHFCQVFSGKIFSQRGCMLQKGSLCIKQGWRQCTSQSLYVTRDTEKCPLYCACLINLRPNCSLFHIIIHSKYFPNSDWLKPHV